LDRGLGLPRSKWGSFSLPADAGLSTATRDEGIRWFPRRREAYWFLVSCIFHASLFLILGLIPGGWGLSRRGDSLDDPLTARPWSDELRLPPQPDVFIAEPSVAPADAVASDRFAAMARTEVKPEIEVEIPIGRIEPSASSRALGGEGVALAQPKEVTASRGRGGRTEVPSALANRSRRLQARMAGGGGQFHGSAGGSSGASEEAVEKALRWLVAHQEEEGNWNFDHTRGLCHGMCRNPGNVASIPAATGLALLPFLGAGYTQQQGEHKEVVRRGLYYLVTRGRTTEHGLDLQDGTMYAQGLATIALCEDYAMTRDKLVHDAAQKALDFIVYAQDRRGGGWRYRPGEPGDVSVTGWELMALKSGQVAGLNVPRPALYLAERFLTSTQYESGAQYHYMPDGRRGTHTTTAIGLLSRMWLGWGRSSIALRHGLGHLTKWGPSADDMYYNYYATQAMFHWGGPNWPAWNRQLRDYLVAKQATAGHESGSWYFEQPRVRGESGGRLCATALGAMILEVYYRHMPLYGKVLADQ
jgi:hypothetical protein